MSCLIFATNSSAGMRALRPRRSGDDHQPLRTWCYDVIASIRRETGMTKPSDLDDAVEDLRRPHRRAGEGEEQIDEIEIAFPRVRMRPATAAAGRGTSSRSSSGSRPGPEDGVGEDIAHKVGEGRDPYAVVTDEFGAVPRCSVATTTVSRSVNCRKCGAMRSRRSSSTTAIRAPESASP